MIKKILNLIKLYHQKKEFLAVILYLFCKLKISKLNFHDFYGKLYGKSNFFALFFIKKKIFNKILNISKSRVISGFYKSTYLYNEKTYKTYFTSQLIGCYEMQVQKKIIDIQTKYKLNKIVNFGAANGFHVLGLVKNNFFQNGLCFENNSEQRKILEINITKNRLKDKVSVYNDASIFKINSLLSKNELKKTLFLIDIEGGEFALINNETINYIKNSYLIIEDHSFNCSKKILKRFWQVIDYYYNYEILYSSSRNPLTIKKLSKLCEDEKWIAVCEDRRRIMNWIVCVPKNNL
jgi:hypothetical protein